MIKNKDDNIHESEALKREGRTNQTITLVECQYLINRTLISKSKLYINLLQNSGYCEKAYFHF